jgi:hypothetical protein
MAHSKRTRVKCVRRVDACHGSIESRKAPLPLLLPRHSALRVSCRPALAVMRLCYPAPISSTTFLLHLGDNMRFALMEQHVPEHHLWQLRNLGRGRRPDGQRLLCQRPVGAGHRGCRTLPGCFLKWGWGLHLAPRSGSSLPRFPGGGIGRINREKRRTRWIEGWVHEAAEPLAKYGDVEIDE